MSVTGSLALYYKYGLLVPPGGQTLYGQTAFLNNLKETGELIKQQEKEGLLFLQRIPHPTSNTLLVPMVMVFGSAPSESGIIFSG